MKRFIGESRDDDIKRTAEEIRFQYLNDHAGDGASQFYKMLWRVLVNPNLSDSAKVIYALSLPEKKNFEYSNDYIGKLANKGPQAVQRAFGELETYGCVKSTYRGTGSTAHRDFPMPAIIAVAQEIEKKLRRKPAKKRSLDNHEQSKTTVHTQPLDNREQSKMTVQEQSFENPERSNSTVLNGQKWATTSKDSTSVIRGPSLRRHNGSIEGEASASVVVEGERGDKPGAGYSRRKRAAREVVPW